MLLSRSKAFKEPRVYRQLTELGELAQKLVKSRYLKKNNQDFK